MNVEPAALTIPAAYLEDVHYALDGAIDTEIDVDRGLSKGLQLLLDQLLDAADTTKVTAEPDTISAMLREIVLVLSGRITGACESDPFPTGDVVELAERLRWAAVEAIRINPGLDGEAVASWQPSNCMTRATRWSSATKCSRRSRTTRTLRFGRIATCSLTPSTTLARRSAPRVAGWPTGRLRRSPATRTALVARRRIEARQDMARAVEVAYTLMGLIWETTPCILEAEKRMDPKTGEMVPA
jgi:hypothetical protein